MDWKTFWTVFGTIFLAELGDKTQLTTLTYAASSKAGFSVFLGAALALVLTSLIGVILGQIIPRYVPTYYIRILAGGFFIFMGIWILVSRN
ncbi:MAG TPA: TMEM165/GDT1 family protein [Candidatus Limnocylindrales bacterium]|nr:TMEM165/GDT1 family protein [Candidatus Limnocylindrales bacterium]